MRSYLIDSSCSLLCPQPVRPTVARRNASSIAAERASLPSSPAEWSKFVTKRLSEIPESVDNAEQRKGLQQLKAFIDANPDFIAERSEEIKTYAAPHWDDSTYPTSRHSAVPRRNTRAQSPWTPPLFRSVCALMPPSFTIAPPSPRS